MSKYCPVQGAICSQAWWLTAVIWPLGEQGIKLVTSEEGRREEEGREWGGKDEEIAGSSPMEGIHRISDCSFLMLTPPVNFFSVMNNFVVLLKAT